MQQTAPIPQVIQLPDMYNRLLTTMRGGKPDRLPFVARMELWYSCHSRAGTLPPEFMQESADQEPSVISTFTVPIRKDFRGARLSEIHRAVGMGQQVQGIAHSRRLRGVEIIQRANGEEFYHEKDPVIDYFPRLFNDMILDREAEMEAEFITPKGTLTTRSTLTSEMVANGTIPVLMEHPIKGPDDFPALEYIYTHAEWVPKFNWVYHNQARMGTFGFMVPFIDRIPFQKIALDLLGEISTFYAINDHPSFVEKMMALMDEVTSEDVRQIAALDYPYIQFDDNLDGMITNPKLFPTFCIPYYQKYTDLLHQQGKKVGSHTDGNLKRLVDLLPETGLDVCESFTPAPLTQCTFDDAWNAFREKAPLIWGGFPSVIFQPDTPEEEFHQYIEHVLGLVGSQPVLFGIADLVTCDNMIERVQYLAQRIEEHELN